MTGNSYRTHTHTHTHTVRVRPHQTTSTLSSPAANKPPRRSNSWGPRFARNGTFKVAYGAAGVLSLGNAYGVMWLPDDPTDRSIAASPLRTQPSSKAGCVTYTVGGAGSEARIACYGHTLNLPLKSDLKASSLLGDGAT